LLVILITNPVNKFSYPGVTDEETLVRDKISLIRSPKDLIITTIYAFVFINVFVSVEKRVEGTNDEITLLTYCLLKDLYKREKKCHTAKEKNKRML
jgi:hypothetical protein